MGETELTDDIEETPVDTGTETEADRVYQAQWDLLETCKGILERCSGTSPPNEALVALTVKAMQGVVESAVTPHKRLIELEKRLANLTQVVNSLGGKNQLERSLGRKMMPGRGR